MPAPKGEKCDILNLELAKGVRNGLKSSEIPHIS